MKNAGWVGMRGIRDVSTRGYFYSGVQPWGQRGNGELEMGFYSYHLDKKGLWGARYEVRKEMPIGVGQWHCVEGHMKLNSVGRSTGRANADGLEELWIDGELSIRKEGLRFRRVPQLRISLFSLETYYHGLPEDFDQANPTKVYFDNVVIARAYIGPITPKSLEHSVKGEAVVDADARRVIGEDLADRLQDHTEAMQAEFSSLLFAMYTGYPPGFSPTADAACSCWRS